MKSFGTAFDRRPSQFVRRANKTFRSARMATGLPTDERCLDLSEQDSVVCSRCSPTLIKSNY